MGIRRAEFDSWYEVEALEPRVMLSADGFALAESGGDAGARLEVQLREHELVGTSTTTALAHDRDEFGAETTWFAMDPDGATTSASDSSTTAGDVSQSTDKAAPDSDSPPRAALLPPATAAALTVGTAVFTNAAGGSWSDSANWQDGHLPAAGEAVTFSGLNSGAIVTFTGDTPALASLTLNGVSLQITGALNTANITATNGATLDLRGSVTSAITGTVSFDATSQFVVRNTATVQWSGDTWAQNGSASLFDTSRFTQKSGVFTLGAGQRFESASTGPLVTLEGGEFRVSTGAEVHFQYWADLNIAGGTLVLQGGLVANHGQAEFIVSAGGITGHGTIQIDRYLAVRGTGTISPGSSDGATGTISIVDGDGGSLPQVTFADDATVHLDVNSTSDFDVLNIQGAVSFTGSANVAIDASAADFGSTTSGTLLGSSGVVLAIDPAGFSAGGSVEIIPGADDTVTAAWDASGSLVARTYSPLEVAWINPAGGNWTDTANWANGRLPEAGEAVTITGLNAGAEITMSGVTVALASLSIDGGLRLQSAADLTIQNGGSLSVAALNLTGANLALAGNATATLAGNVTIGAGATLSLTGTSRLTQSGGAWMLTGDGRLQVSDSAVLQQNAGTLTAADTATLHILVSGAWNLAGGELRLASTATAELFTTAALTVSGGTVTLLGGASIRSAALVAFNSGTLAGHGNVIANGGINFGGTLRPGDGVGATGFLQITGGGAIAFTNSWQVHLDVLSSATTTSDSFDIVRLEGTVTFGTSGGIVLDASDANFGSTTTGSQLGDASGLFYINGTVSGPNAALSIIDGSDHTVTAEWDSSTALLVKVVVETVALIDPQWIAAAGGNWSDPANWQNGRVPEAGDDVTISGLNSGATISFNGSTPVLRSLTLDSGELAITGVLYTGDLTVTGTGTLSIGGAGTSAITGNVSFGSDTSFSMLGTAAVSWTGSTWAQNGFVDLKENSVFTQQSGILTLGNTDQFALNSGTLVLAGGEFRVPTGAALNLYHDSGLTISGGTLALSGGTVAAFNESIVGFSAGVIAGTGTFRVNNQMTVSGTIRPGGMGTTGTLTFATGEDAAFGSITFTGAWAIQIDVLTRTDFDVLTFGANVTFGSSGAIAIDTANANFSGATEGSALNAALVTIDGTLTGDPATVNVTAGSEFSVNATWSGNTLTAVTIGGDPAAPADDTATVISNGLTTATTTAQGMLSHFNLGTINFAAQGRPALSLPTLPTALADLFNLSGVNAAVALPGIGGAATTEEAISALEAAGYTVTTPGSGVELRATLTRTIFTDRAVDGGFSGATFTAPADLLGGVADSLNFAAALNLAATLLQHVVFELRDGVFHLLSDTYLALALTGGATLSGTVRQGGRTVGAGGSTDIALDVRVVNATGGITATAAGTVSIDLSLNADPVSLSYGRDYTLTRTSDTLVTSTAASSTLSGTLTLAGVTTTSGAAATFTLSGTQSGDTWTLTGSGTNVKWLAFTVSSWNFSVTLGPGTFGGSGTFATSLDFLASSGGSAPSVSLGASFNQDSLTFTGSLSNSLLNVVNPAGGTYLSIANFASNLTVITDLDAGTWTGALTFTGGTSTFNPPGAPFTATITDGTDADAHAVTGTYDFASRNFTTTVDQFEMVAGNIVRVAAAGVTLRHNRDTATDQELVSIANVAVKLLFLTASPSTGPPTATAASIAIRTNGITIGAGSLTLGDVSVGSVVQATGASVSFTQFSFLDGNLSADNVTFAATSATLFPGNASGFAASATTLSGTYNFNGGPDGRIVLSAASVSFAIGGVSVSASNVTLKPEADIVFSAATLNASVSYFGVSGTVTGLEITSSGAASVVSLTLDASVLTQRLRIGGLLPFGFEGLAIAFLGDTNGNGVRDAGETFALNAFDVTVTGSFDFAVLAALPFTPIIRVGDTALDDGTDTIKVTFRYADGAFVPWNFGAIEIGVSNLAVGQSLSISGSIRLGGYQNGKWVSDFGGTLTVAAGSTIKDISGEFTVAIDGSLNVATGDLKVAATFVISFKLGAYVSATKASLGFNFEVTTMGDDASFALSVTKFAVSSASVQSLSIAFGDLLTMSATQATFDFNATGEQTLLAVGSLTATLTGVGVSGTASNFAFRADGLPYPGEGFGVSLSLADGGLAGLKWPAWLPLQVTVLALKWDNLTADPLDFTIRMSGSVSSDGLTGSRLTLAGSISDVALDIGLLKEGKFPIVSLGSIGISVGGDIAGSAVSAGLLLGILRVDASGTVIADADTTTPVAQRVLWAAVRGGVEIAGYGGFEIYLGLSQYGPLQGYVKAVVPVLIDYTGATGLSLTNFRAGITFNAELPAITDAREIKNHPEFKPTGELSFDEWRGVMLNSLATQVAANAASGAFGILTNPFKLEGGVTLFSVYTSAGAFTVDADFMMDSTGKFLALGRFELGGTISFNAGLYFDLSSFVSEGKATILFLAELPSEFPLAMIYGSLRFDFGETVDPKNPPAAPFEQFTIAIEGGLQLGVPGIPVFTVDGVAAFEVALNAPSLHVTVKGDASIAFLGELVGVAGDFRLFFGADDTVQAVGILALAPADFSMLQPTGLTVDALALLRFNTTASAVDYTLEIPGQSEPRTFTVAAGEASLLLEGIVGFAPGGTELFRLGGLLSLSWSAEGFDVVVSAELTAGPVSTPLLRFDAQGYLKLVLEGISVGMAAQLELSLDPDDDVLAGIGVEMNGSYAFLMNTTGADVDYTLPSQLAAVSTVDRIHLPRGPPSADGTTVGTTGPYLIVRASGTLAVLNQIELQGAFDLTVANGAVEIGFDATLRLGVGGVTVYSYDATGRLRIDGNGVYGQAALELDAAAGLPEAGLGFRFDATHLLQINTTGSAQTLDAATTLEAGSYARVRAEGALVVGAWRFNGVFDLSSDAAGVAVFANGTVSLGVGEAILYTWGFGGTLEVQEDGIFGTLALSVKTNGEDAFGFGFASGATYTLSLNTTDDAIDGVPAGLGARIRVNGALEIGDWSLDGVYDLTATTTGIGFAASTALVMRAGEDELFRVPLAFEIELVIPGIVQDIAVNFSPEQLGIAIPGLSLSGAARILINTTAQQQGDIAPGPLLQFAVEGQAVIDGLALDGRFAFESAIDRTTMLAEFAVNLGPAAAPLLSFTGEGAFDLSLGGVAGYVDLALTGGVQEYRDFFGADATYFLGANTRTVPFVIGDRTLPAGPLVTLGAAGTVSVAGFDFAGTYGLRASGEGVAIDLDATLAVNLPKPDGDELTLISLTAKGGMHLGVGGLVAAFDVVPDTVDFEAVGLDLVNTAAAFVLRINTTGAEQTVGGVTLEAGSYARIEFNAAITFGVFQLQGMNRLSVQGSTAELLIDSNLAAVLPGIGAIPDTELFRVGVRGGLRIAAEGVTAAFELERGLLDDLRLGHVVIPFGADQVIALHLNTTGEAQTLGAVELDAGRYMKLVLASELDVGLGRIAGGFDIKAGETGLEVVFAGELVVGIPATELTLFSFHAQGGITITARGVAGAVELSRSVGLSGLDTLGIKVDTLGQELGGHLYLNSTGEEVVLGSVTLEAGNYVEVGMEQRMSIGVVGFFGLNTLRLGSDGLRLITDGGMSMGLPAAGGFEGFTVVESAGRNEWHLTSEGVYGIGRSHQVRDPITIAGVKLTPDFSGGAAFTLNTTSRAQTVDGIEIDAKSASYALDLAIEMLGVTFGGETVITIDVDRGYAVLWQKGNVDVTIGGWTPFKYAYEGYFLVGQGGVLTNLALQANGGSGVPGVSFSGSWSLRASTFGAPVTVQGFSVGKINVPAMSIEQSPMLRIHMSGGYSVLGLQTNGEYDFVIHEGGLSVHAASSVSALGITMQGIGQALLSSAGMVANVALSGPKIQTAFYSMSGSYALAINTTGTAQLGVPANYARISVNDASISMPGATLRGNASIDFDGGVTLRLDGLTATLGVPGLAGVSFAINGWMNSAGQFNVSGTANLAVGSRDTVGIFGSAQITISHDQGVRGSISGGQLYVPGGDYANLNGSFVASATEFSLNVDNTAFVLLGGTVLLRGGFGVTLADGVFTIAANNVTAETRIPGFTQSATVTGWLNSNGHFDLNGTLALAIGSKSTAGAFGTLALKLSHDHGISGRITDGQLYVPGGDYGRLNASFRASANEVALDVESTAFRILGGTVLVSGGFGVTLASGVFTIWAKDVTAETNVPGFKQSATISGWFNSNGHFDLNGTSTLALGVEGVAGAFGTLALNLSHDRGINGRVSDGKLYVPGGDHAVLNASFVANSKEVALNVENTAFALLGGTVLLRGGFGVTLADGVFTIAAKEVTAETRIPGFARSATVSGWLNSKGQFDLNGKLELKVGNETLGIDGTLTLNLSHERGISGTVGGRYFVPGDYAGIDGRFAAGAWGFDLTIDKTAFVLLQGAVRLDGGLKIELRDGALTYRIDNMAGRLQMPGFDQSFTLNGWINSSGQFDLSGTAALKIGNETTLGANGSVALKISHEGISGAVSGRFFLPGDHGDYTGSFAAGAWGFELTIDKTAFVLLGGAVRLDGGLKIELRDGALTYRINAMQGRLQIPGFSQTFELNGWINSSGQFDLTGTAALDAGNELLGVKASVAINVSHNGVRGSVDGRLFIPGDYADFKGSFEAGTWGFNVTIDRVRFVLLGGVVLLDGSFILEQRGSTLTAEIVAMKAELRLTGFTQTFDIRGKFNTRGGFDLEGRARFNVGNRTIGAEGEIDLIISDLGVSGRVNGTVYVPGDYARFSGEFEAGTWGFNVFIERVRFVVPGGLLLDGAIWIEMRGDRLTIDVPSLTVELWGMKGTVSGSFNGATGAWRVQGRINFYFGGNFGASGSLHIDVGSSHSSVRAEGRAWAQAEYWAFGWRTYRDWANFNATVNLNDGRVDVRMKFWKFYVTVHVRLKGGFRVWLSNVAESKVFLDVNRNGALDDGEPWTLADGNGNFSFAEEHDPEAIGNDEDAGEAATVTNSLGQLAPFDANGDGVVDGSEIQLYAVNGILGDPASDMRRVYRDENGNGTWDETEISVEVDFDALSALDPTNRSVAGTAFAAFDADGDGALSDAESAALRLELIGTRMPLMPIATAVVGGTSVANAEFVFADANDNGHYDAGEPRVVPDEFGMFSFEDTAALATSSLGRLAPFDANGNGKIDASEGVFVVLGGVDTDSGVTNPVAATALAESYGSGLGGTINPLSSLQVSLVDRGLSPGDASALLNSALALPAGVDVGSFDPRAPVAGDPSVEAAALAAGATVTSLVTGGASLLGNDSDAALQGAVLDQLADMLVARQGSGDASLDLTDAATLATVIDGAGARVGREVDDAAAAAAGTVLANVNAAVDATAAAGGDIDRALAANKAVLLTTVNGSLRDLGNGAVSAGDVTSQFTSEALANLSAAVQLRPTQAPTLAAMENRVAQGADVLRIQLPVTDADSRASDLRFTVTSSNGGVVDGEKVSFELDNGAWFMVVPTATVSAGFTQLAVSVTDGAGSARAVFALTLDGLNPVVQATVAVANQTLVTGQSVTIDLANHFADPDGNATYAVVPFGQNRTVEASIVDGKLVLTARSDSSGLAVLDLVASDDRGTATTRLSVVTYPTVEVSECVRFVAPGVVEIDVSLSNPSTQPLMLQYQLGAADSDGAPMAGMLTFAAGETVKTLTIDLATTGFGAAAVREIELGVNGGWTSGAFSVEINNRNPIELLDLQRRITLRFEFRLSYLFTDLDDEEEEAALFATDVVIVTRVQIAAGTAGAAGRAGVASASTADLVAAASLAALEQPRALRGI